MRVVKKKEKKIYYFHFNWLTHRKHHSCGESVHRFFFDSFEYFQLWSWSYLPITHTSTQTHTIHKWIKSSVWQAKYVEWRKNALNRKDVKQDVERTIPATTTTTNLELKLQTKKFVVVSLFCLSQNRTNSLHFFIAIRSVGRCLTYSSSFIFPIYTKHLLRSFLNRLFMFWCWCWCIVYALMRKHIYKCMLVSCISVCTCLYCMRTCVWLSECV